MNRYVAQTVNTVAWTPGATHQRSSRRVLPRPRAAVPAGLRGEPEDWRDARHRVGGRGRGAETLDDRVGEAAACPVVPPRS